MEYDHITSCMRVAIMETTAEVKKDDISHSLGKLFLALMECVISSFSHQ